jgi:hypothetical protein
LISFEFLVLHHFSAVRIPPSTFRCVEYQTPLLLEPPPTMTRPQRFPFALPTRKSSATAPPPPTPQIVPTQHVMKGIVGVEDKNAKAHKLLGTSNTNPVKTEKSKRWKMKRGISNKLSLVSIAISDVSEREGRAPITQENTRHGHNVIVPQKSPMLDRNLHERPSSPLLGERYQNASNMSDTSSDLMGKRLHQFDSKSSLHSFYNPAKSPLAISQQTSESSARDYALRKGCPPVTGLTSHTIEEYGVPDPTSFDPQMTARPKSVKKRPPRIDLSMLFPKPKISGGTLLSPQRLTHSPSPLSEASAPPLALGSKRSLASTSALNSSQSSVATEREQEKGKILPWEIKVATVPKRMPKPTPAMKHWFDTFQEVNSDDELPDDTQSLAVSKPVLAQLEHRHLRNISEDTIRPQTPPKIISLPSKSMKSVQSSQAPSPVTPQISLMSWQDSSQSNDSIASRPSATSRKTSGSLISSADLQQESVLCLSSSSDDEGYENVFSAPKKNIKKNRDSVATSTYGDAAEICTAETVCSARSRTSRIQSSRPKPSSNSKSKAIPQRSSSAFTGATLNVPKPPGIRSTSSPHTSSFRSSDSQSQSQPSPPPSTRDDKHLSRLPAKTYDPLSDQSPTKPKPKSAPKTPPAKRESRIMAVTREEESLLEAMRQKRASMRQSLFQESYTAAARGSTTFQEVTNPPDYRPRTSHNESQSSFLRLSQEITPASAARPRTSSEVRASLTTGDFIFPDPPLPNSRRDSRVMFNLDSRQGSIQSTHGSLSLAHSHSDALPSPSTSRASPITPTTAHDQDARSVHERFSKELNLPIEDGLMPSPTDDVMGQGHSRTRTHSSGVIFLEGVDEADLRGGGRVGRPEIASLVDEGWPVWAMRGWGNERVAVI